MINDRMTCEFSLSKNQNMIKQLISVLGRKFCLSNHVNTRKGGLLGLSSVMIGFRHGYSVEEIPEEIIEEVVRPILTCFLDSDSGVRYCACEALYNVTKVSEANILILFHEIFDNMVKIVADPNIGVRSAAEVLDRILKDIIVEQQTFKSNDFVPKLDDYIYAKNPFTRMFIISWIRLLDSKIDMIQYLPQLLDGIFNCLHDSTEEIRASTLGLLSEFLNKIVACPTDRLNIPSMTSTILKHARSDKEDVVQYTAIAWLRQFIALMDNQDLINFTPGILVAILPCLAIQSTPEGSIASQLRETHLGRHNLNSQSFTPQSPSRGNICEISSIVNSLLLEQITIVLSERKNTLGPDFASNDLEPILEVLVKELDKQEHAVVKLAVLEWLKRLKKVQNDLIYATTLQKKLYSTLLNTLSARSDAVVKNALRVITELFCFDQPATIPTSNDDQSNQQTKQASGDTMNEDASKEDDRKAADSEKRGKSPIKTGTTKDAKGAGKKVAIATDDSGAMTMTQQHANVTKFIQALCNMLKDKKSVFEERATFIVINLCSMVKPDIIYRSFAEILKDERVDLKFAYNMVQKLNQILLTTQPLFGLRSRLSSNDDDPEKASLFLSLYHAWSHSPIAKLTLCLLTNNYRHANEIVLALSQSDITIDTLTQIDWVVQLIETPVFASLRMKLLDANNNQYLLQSLYGLLMILPQSEAYNKLGNRLDQVYKFISCSQSNQFKSSTRR